jgi:hypothetical protein
MLLGEFEYLMLTAAARLGDEAYGAAIRQEIEDATGTPCSIRRALYDARIDSKARAYQNLDGRPDT